MPPTLPSAMHRAAEFDWGQVIFVIIFLIVGFVQWVSKLIQQRKEAAERAKAMADPRVQRRREEAWRRQVGGAPPALPQQAPPRPAAPAPSDPFAEFEKALRELQEPFKPAPVPAAPPPLPAEIDRSSRKQRRQPKPLEPVHPPKSVIALPSSAPPTVVRSTPKSADANPALIRALRDPNAIRQAVLMREILGPPKALQTPGDSLI